MKVYKFGGMSVKDAEGVKNVSRILADQGFDACMLVVSAMGKTTNSLEKIIEMYFSKRDYGLEIDKLKQKHLLTVNELFLEDHPIFNEINLFFSDFDSFFRRNKSPNYNFVYDQAVSFGEMVSSRILSEYLNYSGIPNEWLDARDFIKTDSCYREGSVDWNRTKNNIESLNKNKFYVTQGFIASDENNFTVTLGREGSDYSAAVFAYCLDAAHLTIWKDVPGVMTGDPSRFENAELLSNISYEEAVEMAYYGASIIHPKTIQPLKQKSIPFFVKSFIKDKEGGTKIGLKLGNQNKESYIMKDDQVMINISTRDFSFIAEEHISYIFSLLSRYKIKVSLIQNSAISLNLCVEDKFKKLDTLSIDLKKDFLVSFVKEVSLFTVRNIDLENAKKFYQKKNILIEQISSGVLQMVIK